MTRWPLAASLAIAALLQSGAAAAQVRWDAGVSLGASARLLSSRPAGQGEPYAGPILETEAHFALIPLVRIGAYAHFDASEVSGASTFTRDLVAGGFDVRLLAPIPSRTLRGYFRAGIGEAGAFTSAPPVASGSDAPSGHFTEVPLALGIAVRDDGAWFNAELGTRLGFGFGGSLYDGRASVGQDVVAGYVLLGVAWGK